MALTREDVAAVHRGVFGHDPAPRILDRLASQGGDLETVVRAMVKAAAQRRAGPSGEDYRRSAEYLEHSGARFGVPRELQVTPTPLKRVLLVGHCLLATWPHRLARLGVNVEFDHVLAGPHAEPVTPHPADAYSFQVTHIANRSVFSDPLVFDWIRGGYGQTARSDQLLRRATAALDRALNAMTARRDAMPVFVGNLIAPQQDFNGRLVPRTGTDSIEMFFERLNAHLREAAQAQPGVHVLDFNQIFATIGRRHLLDDAFLVSAHASLFANGLAEQDRGRLVPSRLPTEYYEPKTDDFILSVWNEAEAMYRTLRQIDQVKMVCVDLDDTLWRGVLAEEAVLDDIDVHLAREGWPLGVAEALLVLKRRGMLLCILSKNDEARARAIFEKVYRGHLALEDFAILKINWAPKAENLRAAMAEANVLPRSVVFLDDNPVERAAIKQAFPEVRVIEAPHYYWRRILLWSAETQTATITPESARRTEMVRAQAEREALRAEASREDFLAGLRLRVEIAAVAPDAKRFARALELLNKSNQFNTSGRRWSAQELAEAAADGGLVVASVSDCFTDYGDTLVAVARGDRIEQLVMSCRVIGLGVENACVAALAARALARHPRVLARIVETDANTLARDLYARCGWTLQDGVWTTTAAGEIPGHVTLERRL